MSNLFGRRRKATTTTTTTTSTDLIYKDEGGNNSTVNGVDDDDDVKNNAATKADEGSSSTSKGERRHESFWGGPGTWLPSPVESFMGWALAIGCLSVSGYHYIRSTIVKPIMSKLSLLLLLLPSSSSITNDDTTSSTALPCWLPLTTYSRMEVDHKSAKERFGQLYTFLSSKLSSSSSSSASTDATTTLSFTLVDKDDQVVEILRSNTTARRLATLAMMPRSSTTTGNEKRSLPSEEDENTLMLLRQQQLIRIWSRVLALPSPEDDKVGSSSSSKSSSFFDISIILPAFRERGTDVAKKLNHALQTAVHPQRIEVLVVDAGQCLDLEQHVLPVTTANTADNDDDVVATNNKDSSSWGTVRIVPFTQGGGRGPCLNHGARHATGTIYTFCHSDTTLPPEWDDKVRQALSCVDTKTKQAKPYRPNSCAFSFGIDTTPAGLNGGPYPPGIKAVETTANIRTQLYSLPYGDQVLSVPAVVFDYLGGFPDQCLMEDYELISLLRRRVALLSQFANDSITYSQPLSLIKEKLVIIGGVPAYCSPRRWQRFGVLYVTWHNSKFVNLYAGGMKPNDLYTLYYGRPPPKRTTAVPGGNPECAEWEHELELELARAK